jgi:NAD(P)H-dependent flavin oxidoreductase YrpB (nitropropane dioxygenase family)
MLTPAVDPGTAPHNRLLDWHSRKEAHTGQEIKQLLQEAETNDTVLYASNMVGVIKNSAAQLSTDDLRQIVDHSLSCLNKQVKQGGGFEDARQYLEIATWTMSLLEERGETYDSIAELKTP